MEPSSIYAHPNEPPTKRMKKMWSLIQDKLEEVSNDITVVLTHTQRTNNSRHPKTETDVTSKTKSLENENGLQGFQQLTGAEAVMRELSRINRKVAKISVTTDFTK